MTHVHPCQSALKSVVREITTLIAPARHRLKHLTSADPAVTKRNIEAAELLELAILKTNTIPLLETVMAKIDDEISAFIAAEKAKVASLTQQVADRDKTIADLQAATTDRTVSAETEAAVVSETAALTATPPTA